MSAVTVHNLKTDNDLIKCQWFATETEVFDQLSGMIVTGWTVTARGLESIDHTGQKIVARPVKIKGQDVYTGIATWSISNDEDI